MDFLVGVEQEVADVKCGTPRLCQRRMATEMVFVHLISARLHLSNFVQHHDLEPKGFRLSLDFNSIILLYRTVL